MTHVDELQKKYPELDREIIIKWETMRYGIRDSEVLDKLANWRRVGGGGYQNRDLQGVTLKAIAEKRPETVRPGFEMAPTPFYMSKGIGVEIKRSFNSLYEIKEMGEGKFALFEGDEKVEDVYFAGPRPRNEEAVTSRGTPASSLISGTGRCFQIVPVRHCEYFPTGDQCKFCNFNPSLQDARSIGHEFATTIRLEDTVEAYKIASSGVRLVEGMIVNGAFKTREAEAKLDIRFVERIACAAPYKPNLSITGQPIDRKDFQRLKDAGLDDIRMQMEVWEPQLFAEVCPGKDKRDGYEGYLEAYLNAVDVFGVGRVSAVFVGGVSLMPPNGHKTWQESRDSLIEGFRWMIRNGIFPGFLSLRLGAGSIYGNDVANQEKLPPTDYYLDAALAHHEAMMEFGLYSKYHRLTWCPLDCLTVMYAGEVGILALAGDVGAWAAECVPEEANFLKRFISSVRASSGR